jgi:hypothetical protein
MEIGKIKHDLRSDLEAVFATLKLLKNHKDLEQSLKEVIDLAIDRKSQIDKNLDSVFERISQ